ncbi:FecR domain-containing protein [Roseomonas hellenica]|uniref:FecR domain-containing protein n=1 Tax=Plastoroseomonas hellenica TaxID=2687306 RepID=A0ABS5F3A6_9PROT|nr:FecR domain-containing protein [Plastoroseomonas hellenica]MBR0666615.1 FecR domain-containing protein [Plastoroseomonas hellenica]
MSLHRRFLSTLLLSAALPPRALASVRMRVGEVSEVTGEATAHFPDAAPRALAPASVLLRQDLITTGRAARLVGRLEGGIEFRLGERASLRVDALTSHGPRAGTVLRIFDGPVLLDRHPGGGHGTAPPIILNFPWGRIGVRGTRFFAGPLDGRHAVFVFRGLVAVESGGGAVLLREGEGAEIRGQGAPPGPVSRWTRARIDRALALVA